MLVKYEGCNLIPLQISLYTFTGQAVIVSRGEAPTGQGRNPQLPEGEDSLRPAWLWEDHRGNRAALTGRNHGWIHPSPRTRQAGKPQRQTEGGQHRNKQATHSLQTQEPYSHSGDAQSLQGIPVSMKGFLWVNQTQ